MTPMPPRIVSVADRPDLAPLVATWRVATFFQVFGGYTVERMTQLILHPERGPSATFVLLEDDTPVGTAGLMHADLETRPDLSPWLAAVYVQPGSRGRGHASALVRRAEQAAIEAGVSTLWLFTVSAEPLYRKLGWHRIGLERDHGRDVVLMRRDLGTAPTTTGSPAPP